MDAEQRKSTATFGAIRAFVQQKQGTRRSTAEESRARLTRRTAAHRKREVSPFMRATVMYEAGDVRVEEVPDARIAEPTDALIRVTRACVCGSDLHPYHQMERGETGTRMGHEAVGVVEDVGADVNTLSVGDFVVMPFAYSDGTCAFCRDGLTTACVHVGFFGNPGYDGAQAEAVRVPYADGTLFKLPVGEDDALMPSLLTLSDVMGTGHHAAVVAEVGPGKSVAVVGDGAVGLCGVIAARRLGAEQIIIMGRHEDRIALAREFGATDVVSERGEEAVERVQELTDGFGVDSVLECVGYAQARATAIGIARPGGAVGRVGVPQDETIPASLPAFFKNVTVSGGPAPVRAYMEDLLPDVLEGRIEPGRVLDRTVGLDGVPDGYRAMDERESIKVMVRP
jgi:threonine dehydrogenase-like Zn-dependent dehydrogenase